MFSKLVSPIPHTYTQNHQCSCSIALYWISSTIENYPLKYKHLSLRARGSDTSLPLPLPQLHLLSSTNAGLC